MVNLLQVASLSAAFSALVNAHGYLKNIEVNGVLYPAWQVGSDDYLTTVPTRYARKVKDLGPAVDFTSKDITYVISARNGKLNTDKRRCNQGGNIPASGIIDVKAGSKVFVFPKPTVPPFNMLTNTPANSSGINGAPLTPAP